MNLKLGKLVTYQPTEFEKKMLAQRQSTNVREEYPAIIVHCNEDNTVNLKVFIDGEQDMWAKSKSYGSEPGTFKGLTVK